MLFNNKYGICFFTERQEPTKDKNSPLAMDERPKQEQLGAIEQEQLGQEQLGAIEQEQLGALGQEQQGQEQLGALGQEQLGQEQLGALGQEQLKAIGQIIWSLKYAFATRTMQCTFSNNK